MSVEYRKVLKADVQMKTPMGGMEPPVPCRYCKHLNWTPYSKGPLEGARIDADTVYTCAAFEDGIPKPLYDGDTHSAELPGDSGIRFEQSDESPPAPWR